MNDVTIDRERLTVAYEIWEFPGLRTLVPGRYKNTQYISLFSGSNSIERLYRAINSGDSGS